jgi:hypothetical protein
MKIGHLHIESANAIPWVHDLLSTEVSRDSRHCLKSTIYKKKRYEEEHLPLHQLRLLKQPRLAEKQASILRRETHLQVVDAGARQERQYVLLRCVQRREDHVRV